MELQNGRPENIDNRLDKEIRVYDFLDKLGIAYQRVDHEAAMTMEACEEIDRTLGDDTTICKNLFLCNRQETNFYLLLMPGDKPFKTKDLSAQIHSARLSFAKPEYMEKYLDITPGSVSISPASDRRGCHEGTILWLSSMYQYIQSQIHNRCSQK